MHKLLSFICLSFITYCCISQNSSDIINTDLEVDGAVKSQRKVDASDGIYPNRVRVEWQYKQQNNGYYTVYRNTSEEEPGDRIRANIKTPQISDRGVEAGVLYYYTVFFKSPSSPIRPIGKDSGYKKNQEYVVEEQELMTGVQDSGNINFGIDSLRILSSNLEVGDKLAFDYHISNTTASPLGNISLKFWLSTDQLVDSTDKLLLTKYVEILPKNESINEQLKASISSSTAIGDYYLIGETNLSKKAINHIIKTVNIQ